MANSFPAERTSAKTLGWALVQGSFCGSGSLGALVSNGETDGGSGMGSGKGQLNHWYRIVPFFDNMVAIPVRTGRCR